MRKAMTFIELISVIVIVAILTAIATTMFSDNKLAAAATRLITDIKYTQHLAVMEDQYRSGDANWQRRRWRIYINSAGDRSYTIFKVDSSAAAFNTPGTIDNIALNPLTSGRLSGGFAGIAGLSGDQITDEMALSSQDVGSLTFGGSCGAPPGGAGMIGFDEMGRPYVWNGVNFSRLEDVCTITLGADNESHCIAIDNESGHTHWCDD
ncbi:MAG: prepilin-type N-terminal cleavage/methylation domain-containing protein [Helicobacteraceae bacterium]|jgi:prepilin-type N-terminal cleavage/methylation domain-containing protein|nr:prepilin-type N-terminal cleavage/methylation domain-containing protein [Helicobacteraceae bacterium]